MGWNAMEGEYALAGCTIGDRRGEYVLAGCMFGDKRGEYVLAGCTLGDRRGEYCGVLFVSDTEALVAVRGGVSRSESIVFGAREGLTVAKPFLCLIFFGLLAVIVVWVSIGIEAVHRISLFFVS